MSANSWGVQLNWMKCAKGYIQTNEQDVKTDLVTFLAETFACGNKADAKELKAKMIREGIWEQARQIARENDMQELEQIS